ncbi:hypothetical protein MUY27_00035 [Mucilaginibacter sp. RS28]|uniref:AAA domain-containing protein n=1 Tax=Mucilaginibacter straminoryzae TaxID=2932774 RepID=A0A9X1WYM7_9SPHI|nr:hypothetical protein [Mucilaginibacter straminoryzae]MCJ8208072.1 hypothetical protein [Mucilaginibacter straminoryzae]
MIKYDYRIERDELDETKIYTPNLPTEIADLVYVQGPNSSGKSTLLNLIALAFYGNKLGPEDLNLSLREKLSNLSEADHQKLEFSIELKSDKSDITLQAKKSANSKDIEVRRIIGGKSKPISYDQFRREYRLIYDIPQDPLSRLPLLLLEIKRAQTDKGEQITRLKKRLNEIITEVNESKKPEKLEEYQRNLETLRNNLISISDSKDRKENEYRNLRNFFALKAFREISNEHLDALEKIKRLESRLKKYQKAENRQSEELLIAQRKTNECISTAEEFHKKISILIHELLPKSEKKRIALWDESSCSNEIKSGTDIRTIRDDALYFRRFLENLSTKDSEQKQEAQFLHSLLSVVENYQGQDFSIPGTSLNIKQFIASLKERSNSFSKLIIKSQQITDCQSFLNDIREAINDGVKHYSDCLKIARERGETIEQLTGEFENEELDATKQKLVQIAKRLQEAKTRLVEYGLNYENAASSYDSLLKKEGFYTYVSYSEDQLRNLVDETANALESLQSEEENCKRQIQLDEIERDRLEKLGTHKFQDYLPQLERLFAHIQSLEKTITVTFNRTINDMIDSKLKAVTEQQVKYSEGVQRFLAAKIGKIRHIDNSYSLKKVDVVSKEIITTTNKKIKFADLGTGQSQGAYIEGLLNSNDNKKIIALFDEVAMMDSATLTPIFKKLKKMYHDNKLLVGIIVQKRDEGILVKPLIEM